MLSEEWSPLKEYDLHHILKSCWQDQQTGLLELKDGEAERSCAWDQGKLVFSNSSRPEDRLPEVLINMGILDSEQYEAAQANFIPEISVGKNLVECGLITQKELVKGAKQQVRNNFTQCFGIKSCEARFLAGEDRLPGLRIPLSVEEGICEGLMALEDRTWISELFEEDLSKSLRVSQPGLELNVEFAPQVLPLLDGTRDFNQVSFECDVEEFPLMKFLYVLQFLDALEWGAPELQEQEVKQELSQALPQSEIEEPSPSTGPPEMAETAFIPKVIPEPEEPEDPEEEIPEDSYQPPLAKDEPEPLINQEMIMPEAEEEIFEEPEKGSVWKSPLLLSGILVLMASGLLWMLNREPAPLVPDPEPNVEESLALFEESTPSEPVSDTLPSESEMEPDTPQNGVSDKTEEPVLDETAKPPEVQSDPSEPPISEILQDGPNQELQAFVDQGDVSKSSTIESNQTTEPTENEMAVEPINEPEPIPVHSSDSAPISPVALDLPAYKKEDKRRRPPPKEKPKRQMTIPEGESSTSDAEALKPAPQKPQPTEIRIEPIPGTEKNQEPKPIAQEKLNHRFFEEPDWERVHQFNQVAWENQQYSEVAQNWQAALSMAKQGWTIACLLACQTNTLQQAPLFLPDQKKVILIPREFNGKPCYWVCFGVFKDQDAAKAAIQNMEAFSEYNPDPPKVVPLSELFPVQ